VSTLGAFSGAQRVAAFLLSLEPARAAELLKTLTSDVVAPVARAMIDLDQRLTRPGVAEELAADLERALEEPPPVRPGAAKEVEELLTRAFGRKASTYVKRVRASRAAGRPFLALEEHPPEALARVLGRESAAVRALVLAQLEPARAANVLRRFPEEAALACLRALATLEAPSPELARTVAEELTRRLSEQAPPLPTADPHARIRSVAEILHHSAPAMEKKTLEALAASDARAADELRERLFSWEDLARLGRRSMGRVLTLVDTRTLAVALKGSSAAVEAAVMASLSTRVRAIVRDEREFAGAVTAEEVRSARAEILGQVRVLIDAGELRPRRGGEALVT
jgi:flagellar motor switch protein FliG